MLSSTHMTCFWDAILAKLPKETIQKWLGDIYGASTGVSPKHTFINMLKARVEDVNINDVIWNDVQLSSTEISEYIQWIREYDVGGIEQGHDTSVCDPFLVLICHIFIYDIDHAYNGVTLRYRNTNNRNTDRRLFLTSDRGHMW